LGTLRANAQKNVPRASWKDRKPNVRSCCVAAKYCWYALSLPMPTAALAWMLIIVKTTDVYDDATMEMAINAKKKALARWSRGSASSLYMLKRRRPPFNINAETTAYGPSPSNRIFTR